MKVTIDEKRKVLTIELPLISPLKPSGSGRTLLAASSLGNKETEVIINDQPLYVGVNAYIYADPKSGPKNKEKEEAKAP